MNFDTIRMGVWGAGLLFYVTSLTIAAGLGVFYYSMIHSAENMTASQKKKAADKKLWKYLKHKYNAVCGRQGGSAEADRAAVFAGAAFAQRCLDGYKAGPLSIFGWKKAVGTLRSLAGLCLIAPCLFPEAVLKNMPLSAWPETFLRIAGFLGTAVFLDRLILAAASLPERERFLRDCMEEYMVGLIARPYEMKERFSGPYAQPAGIQAAKKKEERKEAKERSPDTVASLPNAARVTIIEGDKEGRDKEGRDKEGRDKEGRDKEGRDKEGRDKEGRDKEGWDKDGLDKDRRDGERGAEEKAAKTPNVRGPKAPDFQLSDRELEELMREFLSC